MANSSAAFAVLSACFFIASALASALDFNFTSTPTSTVIAVMAMPMPDPAIVIIRPRMAKFAAFTAPMKSPAKKSL